MEWTAAILLVSAAASAPAFAAGAEVAGSGMLSCAEFNESHAGNTEKERALFDWALGAMSGLNAGMVGLRRPTHDLSALPAVAQMTRIREFCAAEPGETYFLGVMRLFGSLPNNPSE
jgi:hypothetical protein